MTPDQTRVFEIFFPYARRQHLSMQSQGKRFVHYTNAAAAEGLLRDKEVWMRKSSCMNDFMEVQHGLNCILPAYNQSEGGKSFRAALDAVYPDISKEIEKPFNAWIPQFTADTYFTCFSEHDDVEDTFGRLSMWRAYGNGTGVALVMRSAPFFGTSDILRAYTSPVAYLGAQEFEKEFEAIAANIHREAEFIRGLGRQSVVNTVFRALTFAALCTKHPGFREEKEWRVVYSAAFGKSEYLRKDLKTIGGVPQPIYKIPLKDVPAHGLVGIEIPTLVERIIIGPTDYPTAIKEAFIELLSNAGVQDASLKVLISDIPLRR